ncbi:ribosomal protein L28e [Wuchereria bancrofti]|uniref:Large ribosomal subunit protein eL28 n=1 Tax=Wuchereria bancrofti TaxID=6293 RepID=J9EZR9_WUCBA|nr:ribosomal protein L28e [Wuchereria bancrofti]
MASADIQWQIIRKTSSFLRRQRGIPKHFSRERFNIKGVNSIRFNGLVHKKGLDIQATSDGKGIIVAMKKRDSICVGFFNIVTSILNATSVFWLSRITLSLEMSLAQKRASQLLRSLKPVASRRGRRVRKAEV